MKHYFKDPLLGISIVLAITGTLQASQGLLTELVQRYPIAFGITMTLISCATASLTVIKSFMAQQAAKPRETHDDGTASESQ